MAERWFHQFEGAGLDGVVAKPLRATYSQNGRTMIKIKHERTADVVVAGYREHKTSTPERPLLGAACCSACTTPASSSTSASAPASPRNDGPSSSRSCNPSWCDIADHPWGGWQEFLIANPDRVPGTQSRWSAGKDLSFTPLRPERVLEVKYDHMEGRRFRHTAQFKRWVRPRPRIVRVRAAGGARQLRPRGDSGLDPSAENRHGWDYDVVLLVEQALTHADAGRCARCTRASTSP